MRMRDLEFEESAKVAFETITQPVILRSSLMVDEDCLSISCGLVG